MDYQHVVALVVAVGRAAVTTVAATVEVVLLLLNVQVDGEVTYSDINV